MFDLPYEDAQGDANGYPTIAARSVQIAARRPLSHVSAQLRRLLVVKCHVHVFRQREKTHCDLR